MIIFLYTRIFALSRFLMFCQKNKKYSDQEMPQPQPGETKQEYLARCIPEVAHEGKSTSHKQTIAICYSMWDRENKLGLDRDQNGYQVDERTVSKMDTLVPMDFNHQQNHQDHQDDEQNQNGQNGNNLEEERDDLYEYGHVRRASRRRGLMIGSQLGYDHSHKNSRRNKAIKYACCDLMEL